MANLVNLASYSPTINEYFGTSKKPGHYSPSGTQYTRLNLAEFIKPRGLYNKELTSLSKSLPQGAFLAGGFVAALVNPAHPPTDIDIFFNSGNVFLDVFDLFSNPPDDEHAWALRGYKTTTTREEIIANSKEMRVVNFKNDDPERLPIQLIKMVWYDSAESVIDSFDFTVTQFAVDQGDFVCSPAAIIDVLKSSLIVHRHQFPMESLYRLVKYAKKGYHVSPKTLQRLVDDIRAATEMDPPLPFTMY